MRRAALTFFDDEGQVYARVEPDRVTYADLPKGSAVRSGATRVVETCLRQPLRARRVRVLLWSFDMFIMSCALTTYIF